jgi:hypothetical protein
MGRARWVGLFALLSLSASALPVTAKAGDDGDDAPQPPAVVSVRFRAMRDGEYAEIVKVGKRRDPEEVVVQCAEDCDKTVAVGAYRVRLYDATGHEVGSSRVSLMYPTTFRASDPGSRSLAGVGLAMGVVGGASAGVAAVVFGFAALSQMGCRPDMACSVQPALTVAGITALSGLAVSITGWILYGNNRGPFRKSTDYPWGQGVSLGIVPADKGLLGGVQLAF